MSNRKERRKIDKELGIFKAIKRAPNKEAREEILIKRRELNDAIKKQQQDIFDSQRKEQEIEIYTKSLQFYMGLGNTQKEAEEIIEGIRLKKEKRSQKKVRIK